MATGNSINHNKTPRLFITIIYSCIFVWRVPHDMVVTMHARLNQQALRRGKPVDNEIFVDRSNVDFYSSNTGSADGHYR